MKGPANCKNYMAAQLGVEASAVRGVKTNPAKMKYSGLGSSPKPN